MTTKSDRRYVRVYDDDLRRDYPQVWHDDRALATWLRLLAIADKMWPTIPELPRSVKSGALSLLTSAGLVELLPEHCYRIRGHDAERTARRNAASNAAALRWQSDGNAEAHAPAYAEAMPKRERDETNTRRDERAPAPNDPFDDAEGEALAWLSKHGCDVRPGNGYHQKLVVAVEQHGSDALIGMFDRLSRAGTRQGDIKGYLFGAIDALNARARPKLAAVEAEDREEERSESFAARVARTKARREALEAIGKVEP